MIPMQTWALELQKFFPEFRAFLPCLSPGLG